MKAVIYKKYGPPEVVQQVELPVPKPKDREILVKILAATITAGDARLRASDFPTLFWLPARLIFGLFAPKKQILGHEFAGVVEATGKSVSKFQVGDAVFGTTTMLSSGSHAEFICVPEQWKQGVVAHKPDNLSFKEAAALPVGGMTALYLLEKANLSPGQKVLVYGASGSVGSYAVQLAKHLGASVTGVCSTRNLDMVNSLGADAVVDYSREDYTQLSKKFDAVFDAVGKTSKLAAKKVLTPEGIFVSVNKITYESSEHLRTLIALAEQGEITPFIDRSYPLEDIIAAYAYVDSGRKRGNVVIEIATHV